MIDIIVPIYKGYSETKECIESLLSCTNTKLFRVILINDKSPDKEIDYMISELSDNRVIKVKNEKNLGFVKTVNKGMKMSNNDVIILNSDTIVTNNWIDKILTAAYSSNTIGTVTALTNNGTIASVPNFNKDNILPEGFSLKQFSDLVERISKKKYPVIPTGVGHAMFIKREIINEIGLLDELTFGRGYGEEVDFCYRVIKHGYKNVLADDTFIYHYGSTSFKQEKALLVKENRKKITKKYFWQSIKLKWFLLFNREIRETCTRIQLEINNRNNTIKEGY